MSDEFDKLLMMNSNICINEAEMPLKCDAEENKTTYIPKEKMQINGITEQNNDMYDYSAKADNGKMRISIVPRQIIADISAVREYGIRKYSDPENWRRVEMVRYQDALYRHFSAFVDDPFSKDEESGLYHYQHLACNVAFICEMMKDARKVIEK